MEAKCDAAKFKSPAEIVLNFATKLKKKKKV